MKLLLDSLARDFSISAPATLAEIAEAERWFNYSFPPDYKDFLSAANGLEGQANREYLVLWSTKELIDLNTAYKVKEFVTDVIIFGSDGAEEAFGFDISGSPAPIVQLPFIGMGYIPTRRLCGSFEEFLSLKIPASYFSTQ